MHSKSFLDQLDKISSFLVAETDSVSTNLSEFGYRERVKIERCLFLLIKTLCKKKFDCDLQGFSEFQRAKISEIISSNVTCKALSLFVDQVFQLKIYLQKLSNENAYVRGDALSKLGLNKKNVFTFIHEQIKSIIKKAYALNAEQSH